MVRRQTPRNLYKQLIFAIWLIREFPFPHGVLMAYTTKPVEFQLPIKEKSPEPKPTKKQEPKKKPKKKKPVKPKKPVPKFKWKK